MHQTKRSLTKQAASISRKCSNTDTQTYTGTLNAQSKHLPYVWSYRSISLTFVLQICGADWGLMVDYTWYQNNFLCRCLLMWKYSGSGFFFFFSSWSSWLIHEPHHLLFDLTQLCLWNLFQTSCIKIKAAWSPWGSSKLYNGGMRFSLRANDTPQTLLQMHETDEKKREKIQPTAKTNTAFLDINSWSFFISSVISAGCFARGQGGIPWHLEPTFPWLPLHASSRSYSSSGCVRDEPVSLMLK